jgi:diguanylate cyclase (GGDEF)-like protein
MALFSRTPKSTFPPAPASGARPVIESGLRPKGLGSGVGVTHAAAARASGPSHGLPVQWDDEDTTDVTNTTAIMAAAKRASSQPRLTVMSGVSAGQVLSLDGKPEFFVGRSRSADVRLEDQGVSRVHCRIVRRDDELLIEDLGSTNGTIVNGCHVGSAALQAGDRIQIGPNALLQVSFFDEAEDKLARRLFEASTRDPLTRAYNRRYFAQRLHEEISFAVRHGTGLAVMLLDLDHFKAVNDTAGHAAGDAVLRGVVGEIEKCIRTEDLLTRYGGEEFGLLVRVESIADAKRFAERIRARIEAATIPFEGRSLRVTVSIGVAELAECTTADDGEALVALADRRLYRAKLLGRNRVASGG